MFIKINKLFPLNKVWRKLSYKTSEFPYKEYNINNPEGQYCVRLNSWKGTIAEVRVNDQPAGLIAFPY